MVGGAFGVTLTLESEVLPSCGGGLAYLGQSVGSVAGSGPGLFLCVIGTSRFGEGGLWGLTGQRGSTQSIMLSIYLVVKEDIPNQDFFLIV